MKVKTESDFFNRIDAELSWRKTDLTRLKDLILKNEKTLFAKTLLRATIPIIYAHWEGFIKEASMSYISFLAFKGLKYNEHTKGILALHIKTKYLAKSSPYSDFERATQLCDFIDSEINTRSNLKSIPEPIKTKANLNSEVLKEIAMTLNIDYSKFEPYETLIDAQLLDARNGIAHGEYREIDMDFYSQLHDIVIKLLHIFKDEIENRIVLKQYIKLTFKKV